MVTKYMFDVCLRRFKAVHFSDGKQDSGNPEKCPEKSSRAR